MSLPDYLLEPEDDPCEECGHEHPTRLCPLRRAQARIEKTEEDRKHLYWEDKDGMA